MAEVTFYHQERVDGGRRSGLNVDGTSVLHGFIPGGTDRDPALAWYVDVTFTTPTPPTQATALTWLASHAADIRQSLTEAADALSVGIDVDSMPAEFGRNGAEGPILLTVSAMRRLTGRHVGEKLQHLAEMDLAQLFPILTPQA
jgi:hypothetical protein